MSSNMFAFVYLIFIVRFGSNANDFKNIICESKATNIDSIVDWKDYRYIVINEIFYEYDYSYNFRRRAVQIYDLEEFDLNDLSRLSTEHNIERGKYLSGFYIPEIDCMDVFPNLTSQNCTEINTNFGQMLVMVIYNQFTNKYQVISKKYFEVEKYFGCSPTNKLPTNKTRETRDTEPQHPNGDTNGEGNGGTNETGIGEGSGDGGGNDGGVGGGDDGGVGGGDDGGAGGGDDGGVGDGDDGGAEGGDEPIDCMAPYGLKSRTTPRDWLLKGLAYNRRYKYLPVFFNQKNMELLVVLNKEYEMFGTNPSLIREHSVVYWKSIKYSDPAYGWSESSISEDFTYTAFLKDGDKVYLIGEPFQENLQKPRGPSVMLLFDLNTKKITKNTNKNPLELFGCSSGSDSFGFVIIGGLVVILIIVCISWGVFFYWFFSKESKTTYNQSVKFEG